jgi:hypothetical protein
MDRRSANELPAKSRQRYPGSGLDTEGSGLGGLRPWGITRQGSLLRAPTRFQRFSLAPLVAYAVDRFGMLQSPKDEFRDNLVKQVLLFQHAREAASSYHMGALPSKRLP